ncbi:MAG: helix-turn-helix domain-containing protein [Desulfamplus sp.]|nr:helix-turn-helix domain-containing protein [Desulfamplus sp.]
MLGSGNIIDKLLQRILSATGITTQTELAEVLNINRSAITHARNNNKIPDRWILQLYRKFNLNPEWVEFGTGKTFINKSSCSEVEFDYIPKVSAILSAGSGSFDVNSNVNGYIAFAAKWLRLKGSVSDMVAMDVSGDSMEPEIRDGDVVLIDKSQQEIINRKIYAVGFDDSIFIKRLEKHPGRIVLCSDNRAYAPIYLNDNDMEKTRIIGRILWSSREHR